MMVSGTGGGAGLGGTPTDGGVDGGGHCAGPSDCSGKPATPTCNTTTRTCVECTVNSDCTGAKTACDVKSNTCVECTDSTTCNGSKPVCDTGAKMCVECFGDNKACATAEKAFCSSTDVCVGCDAISGSCQTPGSTKPFCGTSGACVECQANKDCHDLNAPICSATGSCVRCDQAGTNACANLNGQTPFCSSSGACLECGADNDCSSSPTTPFCSAAGTCVSCLAAPTTKSCMTLTPTTPLCSSSGACVQCNGNSDCPNAMPVCSSSNSCVACTGDSDCASRGPGVCMSQADGRCASNSETIYVQNSAGCSDSGGTAGGTVNVPFCSLQPAPAIVSASRAVIVVRGSVAGASSAFASNVSIIGQNSGAILGSVSPALHVTGGTTYARDLKLSSSGSMGLQADSGSAVQLEHLQVTQNASGGIQLDGAAFNIHNTAVTDNNQGTYNGLTLWAGILVNNPPASGAKSLRLVTVQNNKNTGITCSASIMSGATGVLATGNTGSDIAPACNFTSCSPASSTCGAQP